MHVVGTDTRHRARLQTEHGGGLEVEDERRGVHSRKIDYSRRREQQACRDYWAKVYGPEAERASRGGVTWL